MGYSLKFEGNRNAKGKVQGMKTSPKLKKTHTKDSGVLDEDHLDIEFSRGTFGEDDKPKHQQGHYVLPQK